MNPPYPSEFRFFWKCIFDLATTISTNEHDLMLPHGCDLAPPGDKLYSSATRLPHVARCAISFLSPNLAIKINTSHGNFPPLCFLVLFWRLQSKIAQIQTVKIFRRSNKCRVFDLASLHPFYTSCSVYGCLMWQAFLGSEGLVRVSLPFIGQDTGVTRNLQVVIKDTFSDFIHVTRNSSR